MAVAGRIKQRDVRKRCAGLLSLKTLVCKLVGVTCSMAGGLIAGKEGPFIHTGASHIHMHLTAYRLCSVFCGSAHVRSAPAGGIVGGGFAAMGSLTLTELFKGRYTFVAPRKYGGFFRRESEHRDFISIGTAAGMFCLRHRLHCRQRSCSRSTVELIARAQRMPQLCSCGSC